MAENTKIEWADHTFNPWTGCTKVGPGCDNCYAEGWAKRSGLVQWGSGAERRRTSEPNWKQPIKWNAEAERLGLRYRVFCASLADVFDNEVPAEWRADLFDLIAKTPNLDWLLVTKRIGNAKAMMADALHLNPAALSDGRVWPLTNVWLGITVVNQAEADRDIPKLLSTPAALRFLSMEPLLGPVNLRHLNVGREANELDCLSHPWTWEKEVELWRDTDDEWEEQFEDHFGIAVSEAAGPMHPTVDWVIVGGESGPHARPMHPDWVRDIRDQCDVAGVPFLFKQWGEFANAEAAGISLDIAYESKSGGFVSKTGRFFGGQGAVSVTSSHSHVFRMGKKQAGRLIDGREHNGFPEVTP